MTIRIPRTIAIVAILACSVATPVSADTVADFYKGKTVKLLIGVGMGSTYGLHARFFADTIRQYIPGNPNIVVQSMPGGGGAKMANYTYNVAPKDGSYIGFPLKYIAVNQMLGRKGLKYNSAKFS